MGYKVVNNYSYIVHCTCTLHILKRRSAVQAKHIHFISCAAHTRPLPCYISTRFSVKGVAKCCQRTPVQGKGEFEVCVRIPSQQESSTRAQWLIKVVYHLYGETGSSTVCTNGRQKGLMVSSVQIGHLPFTTTTPNLLGKPRMSST